MSFCQHRLSYHYPLKDQRIEDALDRSISGIGFVNRDGRSDNWYNEDTPTSTTQRVLAYNPLLYNHTIHYSIYVSFVGILVGFHFSSIQIEAALVSLQHRNGDGCPKPWHFAPSPFVTSILNDVSIPRSFL